MCTRICRCQGCSQGNWTTCITPLKFKFALILPINWLHLYNIKWVAEDTPAHTAKLHLRSVQKPITCGSRAGMGNLQAENVEKLTFGTWKSHSKCYEETHLNCSKKDNGNVQRFFCHIAAKRVEKLCCALYHPRIKPVVQQINTGFWLDKISRKLLPTRELRQLLQNEFVLGR